MTTNSTVAMSSLSTTTTNSNISTNSRSSNTNSLGRFQLHPVATPALHHLHLFPRVNMVLPGQNNTVSPHPQLRPLQQQRVVCIPHAIRCNLSSTSPTAEGVVATPNTSNTSDTPRSDTVHSGAPQPSVFLFSSPKPSSFSSTHQHNEPVRIDTASTGFDPESLDNESSDCEDDSEIDEVEEIEQDNEGEKAASVPEALLALAQSAEEELERDQRNRSSIFTFEPTSTPSVHPLVHSPSPTSLPEPLPTSTTPPPRVDSPEENAVAQELSSLYSRSDTSCDEGCEEEEREDEEMATTPTAFAIAEEAQTEGESRKRRRMVCSHPGCFQTFTTRFSMKRHSKIHTGEKPWSCTFCGRVFAEKSTLKRHTRTHTREKPFRCLFPGCTKVFADRTNLKRHESLLHTHGRSRNAKTSVSIVAAAAAAIASASARPVLPSPVPSPVFMNLQGFPAPIAVTPVSK